MLLFVLCLNKGTLLEKLRGELGGLGKSTVGIIEKEVDTDKENNLGGRPSKHSACDKTSIIRQIQSGKLDTAIQATHFINSTFQHPVHPQTVRRALQESGFK